MNKSSFLLPFFYLLVTNTLFAIDANITYATFNGLDQENYVEVYLHIKGKTLEFSKEDKMYQAAVEVTLLFRQGETIKAYDRYVLKSPKIYSKKLSNLGVVDLKRLNLPNGDYELEVILEDLNDLENKNSYISNISMDYSEDAIQVSDIELLGKYSKTVEEDKYSKHGLQLKPFTYSIYPSYESKLVFYTEIYNTDKKLDGAYLVRYYLTESGKQSPILGALGFKKQAPKEVSVVLAHLDIAKIPTGKYDLVVEVRNNKNELITAKSLLIHRSNLLEYDLNDYQGTELAGSFVEPMEKLQVKHAIQSVVPKMESTDIPLVNKVIRTKDLDLQKRFLLHYWIGHDEVDPSAPYEAYQEEVDYVNDRFTSAAGKGFETDRGYIYLRYGPPKDIVSSDSEPSASPYQIWEYDILGTQRNVKFVFYNPSLAAEQYVLLHSTARGEVRDPQWQRKIYKGGEYGDPKDALEGTGVEDHFGGNRAGALFDAW